MSTKVSALCVTFFLVLSGLSANAEDTDRYTKKLQEIVSEQQQMLEAKGYVFAGLVKASFGFPPGMEQHQSRGQDAWYVADTDELRIKPSYKYMFLDADIQEGMIPVMHHELGHSVASHAYRRTGYVQPVYEYAPPVLEDGSDAFYGYKIVSEGIGRVFERMENSNFVNDCNFEDYNSGRNVYLPQKRDDLSWRYTDMLAAMMYEGGYCLAKPVMEAGGQRGVEYLVSHPLRFPDWNLREAVNEYITTALSELESKKGQ